LITRFLVDSLETPSGCRVSGLPRHSWAEIHGAPSLHFRACERFLPLVTAEPLLEGNGHGQLGIQALEGLRDRRVEREHGIGETSRILVLVGCHGLGNPSLERREAQSAARADILTGIPDSALKAGSILGTEWR
jgi:hypothetical protein